MAKIDLQAAYRSVLIHPSQYPLTGLKWRFAGDSQATYMVDTRLPFGARLSPGVFHKLTQAAKAMMCAKGYTNLIVYLDDFLLVAPTYQECSIMLSVLIKLVRSLGFSVACEKVCGPSQVMTFLGVELDSGNMEIRLLSDKMQSFCELLDSLVLRLKQCQAVAGKLNWAQHVVRAGSIYLRRLLGAISKLQARNHRMIFNCGT